MNWGKPSKLQVYSFIGSMPLIDFLLNYIMYDDRIFSDIKVWLISFPLIFLIGIASWRTHVMISNMCKRKLPGLKQTKLRLMILGLCIVPFMSSCITVIFFLYDGLGILGYKFTMDDFVSGLIVGFSVNLIFETLYEADYMLEKYKESLQEKETMRMVAMEHEFDVLKSQVNPHFLFNCFNTLSSLISEDKQKAETFLDELSKVYRYLLRNNQDGLSTVDNEIKFIRSYYQLLQTRYGDAVELKVRIDKKYDSYLLPSLSLQLLVENVVKHNVLSKSMPVLIEIYTTGDDRLIVNNNLQRRIAKAPSNKVGLNNIKSKYSLLKMTGFQVMTDTKNFTVELPLISNTTALHPAHARDLKGNFMEVKN